MPNPITASSLSSEIRSGAPLSQIRATETFGRLKNIQDATKKFKRVFSATYSQKTVIRRNTQHTLASKFCLLLKEREITQGTGILQQTAQ